MKKHFVHFYLGLSCLYSLQGTLYASGGIFSQALLAIKLVISFYFFLVANFQFKLPKVLRLLSALIVVWIIYGSLSIMSGSKVGWISSYYYLRNILNSLLPIYVFYVLVKRGQFTERVLMGWLYIFILIGILQFYRYETLGYENSGREEFTNNTGYTILSILPLLPLLYRKPLVQYSILALLLFFILQSFKRGAIVSGFLCAVFLLIENHRIGRKENRGADFKQIIRVVLTISVIIASVYFVQAFMSTSDFFVRRIEKTMEGDSSGRDVIYSTYYSWFLNQSNPFYFLFGNGADATIRIFSQYAHNDWLEIAINNGVLIMILYAIFWVSLIRKTYYARKKDSVAFMMLVMYVIVYLFRTFFSMSYNDITIYASCALGYALATTESIRRNELSKSVSNITTS